MLRHLLLQSEAKKQKHIITHFNIFKLHTYRQNHDMLSVLRCPPTWIFVCTCSYNPDDAGHTIRGVIGLAVSAWHRRIVWTL